MIAPTLVYEVSQIVLNAQFSYVTVHLLPNIQQQPTNCPINQPSNAPKRLQQGTQAELYSEGGSGHVFGCSALAGLPKLVGLPTLPAHEEGEKREMKHTLVVREAVDTRTPGPLSRRYTKRLAGDHVRRLCPSRIDAEYIWAYSGLEIWQMYAAQRTATIKNSTNRPLLIWRSDVL